MLPCLRMGLTLDAAVWMPDQTTTSLKLSVNCGQLCAHLFETGSTVTLVAARFRSISSNSAEARR